MTIAGVNGEGAEAPQKKKRKRRKNKKKKRKGGPVENTTSSIVNEGTNAINRSGTAASGGVDLVNGASHVGEGE